MPVIVQTITSKVTGLWGRSFIRQPDGTMRPLKLGDVVVKGDVILTEQDALVQLSLEQEAPAAPAAATPVEASTPARPAPTQAQSEASRAIAAVERGDKEAAPGAGEGSDGGLQPGLRVGRVVEATTPASLRTDGLASSSLPFIDNATPQDDGREPPPPPPAEPELSVNDVRVNEADGRVTFTITLNQASTLPVTVNYALVADSARAGLDFDAGSGTLSFAPGQTTLTVQVPLRDDGVHEGDERFLINLSEPVNARIADGLGLAVIADNDNVPDVTGIAPSPGTGLAVEEGTPLSVVVTLSNPSDLPTTLPFNLGGGSATPGADHGTPSFSHGVVLNPDGTITVPPGVTEFTVTVPTVADGLDEADETLPLTIGGVTITATVVDTTPAPALSVNDVTVNEAAGTLSFTVGLSAPSAKTITVDVATQDGTALAGLDYSAFTGTLTFAPGVVTQTVTVPILDDTVFEPTENFRLQLTNALNASIAVASGLGQITDNDTAPTVGGISATPEGATVPEGSPLVFTVTLTGSSATPTLLPFKLEGVSAAPGDFGAPVFSNGVVLNADGTLTVPPGVASFTVTVPTVQDTLDEPDETVRLTVGEASALGTIVDDDAAPVIDGITPGAGVNGGSATEGADLAFTVRLSNPSSQPVSFPFSLGGGTAAPGDFGTPVFSNGVVLNADGTITVPPGVTEFTVTVPTVQDTLSEPDETVVLTVGGASATGIIVDDDGTPGVTAVTSPQATEGGELVFGVTLSGPSSTPLTLPFTLGGSATAADLGPIRFTNGVTQNPDGSLNVPPGVTQFDVIVPTLADGLEEPDETVVVGIGGATGTGTIADADPTPTVSSITSPQATEGGELVFGITLSGPSSTPLTLPFTLGGSATAADLGPIRFTNGVTQNPDGSLNVPPGVTQFDVIVPTLADGLDEPDETVVLTLDGTTATGTIADADPTPTVSTITSPQATEGGDLVFGITLSGPSSTPLTLPFTLGGSATAADLGPLRFTNGVTQNPDGTLNVPPGVTQFDVIVPTLADGLDEPNETVVLGVGNATATGTLVDADAPPSLSIGDITVDEADGSATFTVTLSSASGQAVTVAWATADGTARSGSDYTAATGSLTFAPGVLTQNVTIALVNDAVAEPTETFGVTLGGAVNATLARAEGTATVLDDEAPVRVTGITATPAVEGNDLVFNVTLSGTSQGPVTLPFNIGGGSAGPEDLGTPRFTNGVTLNPDGTLNVPPGVTSFDILLPTVADGVDEPDETVVITVGGVSTNVTLVDGDPTGNRPPVANPDSNTTREDEPVRGNVLANDSDPEGATLRITGFSVAGVSGGFLPGSTAIIAGVGTINIEADGRYVFNPAPHYNGPVPVVSYTVSDGSASSIGSLTLNVTPVNDAPDARDDVRSTPEDTPATANVLANDSDVEGQALSVTGFQVDGLGSFAPGATANLPGVGSFTLAANGQYTFTPAPNFNGTVPAITYTVSDGSASSSASLSLVVEPRNDAPVAQPGDCVVSEEGLAGANADDAGNPDTSNARVATGRIEASDVDGGPLRYTWGGPAAPVFSGGQTVSFSGAGTATLVGRIGTTEVLRAEFAADGSYTVTLLQGLDHPVAGSEDALTVALGVNVLDASGASGQTVLRVSVEDDSPVFTRDTGLITLRPNGNGSSVADLGLSLGADDGATARVQFSGSGVDAQGRITASFTGNDGNTQTVLLTSNGQALRYQPGSAPGSLNAVAEDGRVVFTVSADAASGQASVSLLQALDTPVPVPLSTTLQVQGVDADGDTTAQVRSLTLAFNGNAPVLQPDSASTRPGVPVSGNVLANDSDPDGDALSVTGYQVLGVTGLVAAGQASTLPGVGTLVINADGSFTFSPAPGYVGEVPRVNVIVSDGTFSAASSLSLVVQPENPAPVFTAAAISVSEEGLANGLPDATGNPVDSGNSPVATGQLVFAGGLPADLGLALQAPGTVLFSGGQLVTWQGQGTGSLTAVAGGRTVATFTVDAQGQTTFTLLQPIDHATGQGENIAELAFGLTATSQGQAAQGELRVRIEDDQPLARTTPDTVVAVDTNVLVVLDISSSMDIDTATEGPTRLELAVQSMQALLDRYDALGDVRVRLVAFGTHAQAVGEVWVTVAEAKSLLASLPAVGSTNYDEALADAMAAFSSPGRLEGGQNVAYFLSDGLPTLGAGTTAQLVPPGTSPGTPPTNGTGFNQSGEDTGIQAEEARLWQSFLSQNQVTAWAVGMGAEVTDLSALQPIAYDGRTGLSTGALVAADLQDLERLLLATLNTQSGTLYSGLSATAAQLMGADGGHVASFTLDGVTYRFDPAARGGQGEVLASDGRSVTYDDATHTLSLVSQAGGRLQVDMDTGALRYQAAENMANGGYTETYDFALRDADGDVVEGSGTLLARKQAVLAGNDGDDVLRGTAQADVLLGGAGNDVLIGAGGDDLLFGGVGSDVFRWELGDAGTPGQPAVDTVGDFDLTRTRAEGGDVLDLRDLLQGESAALGVDDLSRFIDVDTSSLPGSTVLRISTQGGFTDGPFEAPAEDQRIVLQGVDVRSALGLDASAPETQVLNELLVRQQLQVGP